MLGKVTTQTTQKFLAFLCYQRTQLNAAHAQLLEKLRPIAFLSNDFKKFGKTIVQKPRK